MTNWSALTKTCHICWKLGRGPQNKNKKKTKKPVLDPRSKISRIKTTLKILIPRKKIVWPRLSHRWRQRSITFHALLTNTLTLIHQKNYHSAPSHLGILVERLSWILCGFCRFWSQASGTCCGTSITMTPPPPSPSTLAWDQNLLS